MISNRWVVGAAVAMGTLWQGAAALAQQDAEAVAALQDSINTIETLEAVSYKARRYGEGAMAGLFEYTGDVMLVRTTDKGPKYAPQLIVGSGTFGNQDPEQFAIASDGDVLTWIDYKNVVVKQRPFTQRRETDPAMKLPQQHFLLTELLEREPYKEELAAPNLKLEGVEKVRDEMCKVVTATWDGSGRKVKWWLSTVDNLPRRVEHSNGDGTARIAMLMDIWDMNARANHTVADFTIETPSGFTEDFWEATGPAAAVKPQDRPRHGLDEGAEAPSFEVTDASGQRITRDSLAGNVAVMAFWGPMFPQSIDVAKAVQSTASGYNGQNVKFMAMGVRGQNDQLVKDAARQAGITMQLVPNANTMMEPYKIPGVPAVYVIDGNGRVVDMLMGPIDSAELRGRLSAAIDKGLNGEG